MNATATKPPLKLPDGEWVLQIKADMKVIEPGRAAQLGCKPERDRRVIRARAERIC